LSLRSLRRKKEKKREGGKRKRCCAPLLHLNSSIQKRRIASRPTERKGKRKRGKEDELEKNEKSFLSVLCLNRSHARGGGQGGKKKKKGEGE